MRLRASAAALARLGARACTGSPVRWAAPTAAGALAVGWVRPLSGCAEKGALGTETHPRASACASPTPEAPAFPFGFRPCARLTHQARRARSASATIIACSRAPASVSSGHLQSTCARRTYAGPSLRPAVHRVPRFSSRQNQRIQRPFLAWKGNRKGHIRAAGATTGAKRIGLGIREPRTA